MTISKSDWEAYVNKLAAINRSAAVKMRMYLERNGYSNVEDIIGYAVALSSKYGETAAALACEMYEAVAASQGFVTTAEPAPVMPYGYVAKAVQGVLQTAPSTVPNVVARTVKQAGADTILQNAERDGAQFAWIPSGDTCAFCITLASRGWRRISKGSLKNGHAEHIHSNCNCEYAVRFDGKSGVAGYNPERYAEMYYGADGDTPQDRINAIRRGLYAEDKDRINAQKRAAYHARKMNE